MKCSDNGTAHQIARLFNKLIKQELRAIERSIESRMRELNERIEAREAELKDDGGLDTRFEEYKDGLSKTKRPASRVQERRLFYNWEARLRSELGSWRMELAALERHADDPHAMLTNARRKAMRLLLRETLVAVNPGPNNVPKSDREAYDALEDCLIPVIQLMKRGKSHPEAFRTVAEKLGIRRTTVAAGCTRGLGLSTEQFVNHVSNGRIVQIVKKKYPRTG